MLCAEVSETATVTDELLLPTHMEDRVQQHVPWPDAGAGWGRRLLRSHGGGETRGARGRWGVPGGGSAPPGDEKEGSHRCSRRIWRDAIGTGCREGSLRWCSKAPAQEKVEGGRHVGEKVEAGRRRRGVRTIGYE
jgi:hypothetical protein